ncbi:MAG: hypothetical protein E2604_02905, partial [Flavobacterium sp.]|nr:hypothetical protein [Flavobacterium sp.]
MKNLILLFFVCLLSGYFVSAQTTIKGKVTSDGVPLQYANVLIAKTQLGASTDANGLFTIENVSDGT